MTLQYKRASGAVVARPSPMRKVWGSRPVRDKDFRVRMRRPNYLGLVTITSFGWDDKPRSSVCTHSEHLACTIKILQSLCVSHKIVETYRNQHAQSDPVWSLPVILRIELGRVKGRKRKILSFVGVCVAYVWTLFCVLKKAMTFLCNVCRLHVASLPASQILSKLWRLQLVRFSTSKYLPCFFRYIISF
jgi:hypothetical protein